MSSTEALLDQAIAAAAAGNRRNALGLLARVIELDARNERAWLLLAEAVQTDAQRIDCLERVLSINPDNRLAEQRLQTLRLKAPTTPTPPSESQPAAEPPPLPSSPPIDTGPAATAARQDAYTVLETTRLSCPTCGARLEVTEDMDRFACLHCGNEVLVTRRGGTPSIESPTPATPPHMPHTSPDLHPPPSPLPITTVRAATPAARSSFYQAKRPGRSRWKIIWCVACLLVICIAIWICLSSTTGNDSSPSTFLTVGDKAILYDDQGVPLLVAADKESFDAAIDASVAGDDYAKHELVLTGRVFSVNSGTRVLVIDKAIYATKVRILEGPYAGTTGWVPDEFLRPE